MSKTQKSVARNPAKPSFAPPRKKIKERKFVVATKRSPKSQGSNMDCKCKDKSRDNGLVEYENFGEMVGGNVDEAKGNKPMMENIDNRIRREKDVNKSEFLGLDEVGHYEPEAAKSPKELISSTTKQRRDMLQEEPRSSVPGPGTVLHLVKAFENLLGMPKELDVKDEKRKWKRKQRKGSNGHCLGCSNLLPRAPKTQKSSSAFCPGELFVTADSFWLLVSSSLDSSKGSEVILN
ncbi:LOW QUALITY PROTEIN: hypothetical protein Cgig2_028008 [Carnegiea gigantea]|uniref:Uncharacterized protein n=1 Tax=Carnegiea gigantea TaxID=171969 RepID=A0A9Q1JNX8_9CARY|nr:LOW QUALITY PROTEIN: hypothetical protein Cgig2_028008 [Carnegiea gigantea]